MQVRDFIKRMGAQPTKVEIVVHVQNLTISNLASVSPAYHWLAVESEKKGEKKCSSFHNLERLPSGSYSCSINETIEFETTLYKDTVGEYQVMTVDICY